LTFPLILFGPVLEKNSSNAFLSQHPSELYKQGKVARVPLITGNVEDEGEILTLSEFEISIFFIEIGNTLIFNIYQLSIICHGSIPKSDSG